MKLFIYIVIAIVAISVIAGFFVVDLPNEERLYRVDEKRINDLQYIQGEIISYWQAKSILPSDLQVLNDDTRGVRVPRDPVTKTDYGFSAKSDLSFEICARFERPSREFATRMSEPRMAKPPYSENLDGQYFSDLNNWAHGAGYVCYNRTLDPDFFKK